MKIVDTYTGLLTTHSLRHAHPVFRAWGYNESEIKAWFQNHSTPRMRETASDYLREVQAIVDRVEGFFGKSLPGELVLVPSMGEVDGFARYDSGTHSVLLGIDFPDASLSYLRALTAHELSHVYRDHSPEVWKFLGKPLSKITREEYLENTSGREHLVSEGLATLASQTIYPDVPLHDHHYYEPLEMNWCLSNESKIHEALTRCLAESEPDPWKFYSPNTVAPGAPSRTHYFWAARKLSNWIQSTPEMTVLRAHALPAEAVLAF